MFVKLSDELRETLKCNKEVVPWTELRAKLKSSEQDEDDKIKHVLKGSKFMAAKLEEETETVTTRRRLTNEQYSQLISSSDNRSNYRSEIVIVPDFEWGGEGCLGCDVGSGMVHWIPKKGQVTQQSQNLKIPEINQQDTSILSTTPLQSVSPVPRLS